MPGITLCERASRGYFAEQPAEIMRTAVTRRCCAPFTDQVGVALAVGDVLPALDIASLRASSVPVTSIW